MSRPGKRTIALLAAVALLLTAVLGILYFFAGATQTPAPATAISDDELAARLAGNPALLLHPGEHWRELPAPARAVWTTWRFSLMAGGTLPWAVDGGMPTAADMRDGFIALGLPRGADLVDAYAAGAVGPERTTARQARFDGMRTDIAEAQLRYLRTHLAQATHRAE